MRLMIFGVLLATFNSFGAFPHICPKCWYEIPNSNLSAVFQDTTPPGAIPESLAIVTKNGGAFDTRRNRLIVTGGGQYSAGNQVYAFNLDSLKWTRLTDGPIYYEYSQAAWYKNGGANFDYQQPRGANNFDQIEYDSTTDNLYLFNPTAY